LLLEGCPGSEMVSDEGVLLKPPLVCSAMPGRDEHAIELMLKQSRI